MKDSSLLTPSATKQHHHTSFVVVSKQIKPKKREPYLALTLGDRTGQIEAKMWDNVEDAMGAFEQDDSLRSRDDQPLQSALSAHHSQAAKMVDSEVDFGDYCQGQ